MMEKDKIHFNATGFLKDAKYSFHVYPFLSEYSNSFGNAESLTLNIDEVQIGFEYRKPQSIISDDGKTIEINVSFSKFCNPKGVITGQPEPAQVFETLRFVLDKVVNEYYQQFSHELKKLFTDYSADEIENIKNRTLLFGIGSRRVDDSKVMKTIIGRITTVYLSANPPHIPTEVDITLANGNVEKVHVFAVKKIYEI